MKTLLFKISFLSLILMHSVNALTLKGDKNQLDKNKYEMIKKACEQSHRYYIDKEKEKSCYRIMVIPQKIFTKLNLFLSRRLKIQGFPLNFEQLKMTVNKNAYENSAINEAIKDILNKRNTYYLKFSSPENLYKYCIQLSNNSIKISPPTKSGHTSSYWNFYFKDPMFVPWNNFLVQKNSNLSKNECDIISFNHTRMHSSIRHQGSWGNCWIHALSLLLEEQYYLSQIENNINNPKPVPISRAYIQKQENYTPNTGGRIPNYISTLTHFFQQGAVLDPNNSIDDEFFSHGGYSLKLDNSTPKIFHRKNPRFFLFMDIQHANGIASKYLNLSYMISRNQKERESIIFLIPGHAIVVDGIAWINNQCKFHVQDSFFSPQSHWHDAEMLLNKTQYVAGFVNANTPYNAADIFNIHNYPKMLKYWNKLSDQAKSQLIPPSP